LINNFFDLVEDNAKCHNHPEPEVFFDYESTGVRPDIIHFCKDCKIVNECFDYAIKRDVYGVWAGTTRNQRKEIQKHYNIEVLTYAEERGILI